MAAFDRAKALLEAIADGTMTKPAVREILEHYNGAAASDENLGEVFISGVANSLMRVVGSNAEKAAREVARVEVAQAGDDAVATLPTGIKDKKAKKNK